MTGSGDLEYMASVAGLPQGIYVKSVLYGGVDMLADTGWAFAVRCRSD